MDSKSPVCMFNNGHETNHTSNISIRVHFLINFEKCEMKNIEWCEGGLQYAVIVITHVGKNYLNTRMKYIIVRLNNW